MRKYLTRPLRLLLILIAAYSLLLVLVFIPSPERLEANISGAVETLVREGGRWKPVLDNRGTIDLDSITDRTMVTKARGEATLSPLQNAFSGYARYWHGYLVFLRPLLMVFSLGTIRYLSLFHFTLLLFAVAALLAKRLGKPYAALLLLVLCLCNYHIIPFSLQYASVFYLLLYALLAILRGPVRRICDMGWLVGAFLAIGSVTNFLDFLTAPLLTLGIPLAVCLLLRNQAEPLPAKTAFHYLLIGTLYWGAGYALTWVAKWGLSYLIDSRSIMESVMDQANLRMFGSPDYPLDRLAALTNNLEKMFLFQGLGAHPLFCLLAGGLVLSALALLILRRRKPLAEIKGIAPILCLCLYPYLWYMAMANHSQAHDFFTYRIQAVSVFALGAFVLNCVCVGRASPGQAGGAGHAGVPGAAPPPGA